MTLEKQIETLVGEVRTEAIDMSFGEIVNLHKSKELVIQPEYQRLFRWSTQQRSNLIESILLKLPIPQIFVIENDTGVFELIDGLQRISSVLQFIEPDSLNYEPLILEGCSLVTLLNNKKFHDLPLSLRLGLKRSPIRMVIIKKQSKHFLRYELFKRLNTGGSNLAPQEIRNCSARMLGNEGVKFYSFIIKMTENQDFASCTETLPLQEKEKKGTEELVLRFFATKNSRNHFKGSVKDWLDNYMEEILITGKAFHYESEEKIFSDVFRLTKEKLGDTAFLRYRGHEPIGALPPAYFEAISVGMYESINQIRDKDPKRLRKAITELVQTDDFREVTGPGANSREKLERRINLVSMALLNA